MTALQKDRVTPQFGTPDSVQPLILAFPVAAATTIYGGSLVATDSSGDAVPASANSALKLWGRAERQVVNTTAAGFGNAGDLEVTVKPGVFYFANGDGIVQADLGKYCYAKDDQTVTKDDGSGSRPLAGVIYGVDSTLGVAVGVGFASPYSANPELGQSSANFARNTGPSTNISTITAAGAFTVAGNDGVTNVAGDTVLVYAQTSTFENGPYVVGTVASGSASLSRPDWWPGGGIIKSGTVIRLGGEGTLFKGTEWKSMAGAATVVVGSADPALFPGVVMQSTALVSGTSSIANVPVFSATKTCAIVDYISGGQASTVMYQTSGAPTASTTGPGTVVIAAKSAPATTNTGDSAVVNVGVVNW